MSFLRSMTDSSLRDKVRSSVICVGLEVEPLLLCIKRSQLRWSEHLVRMPPGPGPSSWEEAPGRTQAVAWERLGIPQSELVDVARER